MHRHRVLILCMIVKCKRAQSQIDLDSSRIFQWMLIMKLSFYFLSVEPFRKRKATFARSYVHAREWRLVSLSATHMLQSLHDTLRLSGSSASSITAVMPYFGYARQVRNMDSPDMKILLDFFLIGLVCLFPHDSPCMYVSC